MQAYCQLTLLSFEDDDFRPFRSLHRRQVVSPAAAGAAFHPYCEDRDTLHVSYDHINMQFIYKLRLNLCLLPVAADL